MDLFAKCYERTRQDDAREAGIYPYFHALESRQDTEVVMEGKRRIMLGSNNYLGLTTNPEVIEAGLKALEQYGTGCSGSRFLNGTLQLHIELEEELAKFLGKEAALSFSTGYQSNLGIISALAEHGDYIIMDRENHASLYDACRLSFAKMVRFKHNDMADLEEKLRNVPESAGILIVTDGVFSMAGDIANLPEICRLAKQYGARVMVDDAHGLGVIGKGGRGTASYYGLEDQVDIYMGTFSKSLASLGGYMAASARVIDYVKHCSRPFIFSASITPASCASALAALKILEAHPELPETLQARALFMRSRLAEKNIRIRESNGERIPIIPIYTYELEPTLIVTKDLYDRGVYVNSSIPPAVAPGECLLRTSLMATHTEALIEEAVDIIAEVLNAHHIGE
ncbi:MAG: aminotransferase class I/II-fold pyridoxal phosphate-dependent enzyme [Eubacterium sp.]|nr:aminotransferase class I/II-fold pyridoxal phosphate-dependent enzyme [Eubacterium sp.]